MRYRIAAGALSIAMAVLVACGGDGDAPTVAVSGYVHAGPTCPVVQDPPDPACADRAVAGAVLEFVGPDDRVAGRVTTDGDGGFSLQLPAGSYTMVPQPVEGLLGTPGPSTFEVGEDPVSLDVAYDTGIR